MNKINRLLQGTIILFSSVVIAVIASEFFEKWSASFESGLLLIFAFVLILNTILVTRLMSEVKEVVNETINSIGIRVRYVEDRWTEVGFREGRVFEAVQSIVNDAEEEILISGYNDPTFDPTLLSLADANLQDTSQKRRIAYLETIEKKLAREGKNPFKYYRILQMPNAQSIILSPTTLGPVEFAHCRSVLEVKRKVRNPSVNIMKVETERISTFMIVDGKFLILSDLGTRRTERGEGEYLAGVFIIEDLTGTVISGFREYFWRELVPSASIVDLKDLYLSGEAQSL